MGGGDQSHGWLGGFWQDQGGLKCFQFQNQPNVEAKDDETLLSMDGKSVFSYLDILSTPFDIEILINDICAEFFLFLMKASKFDECL